MQVRVTRTYLALRRGDDGQALHPRPGSTPSGSPPAPPTPPWAELHAARDLGPAGYRALYRAVGLDYNWRDRLAWSDARLAAYLADPAVAVWILTVDGAAAGYFELRRTRDVELPRTAVAHADSADGGAATDQQSPAVAPTSERPCELVYFGLVRGAQGRGLGRWLLEQAIAEAWAGGADMLWLHSCSLDHPAAIPNYRARGFRPFATFVYDEEVPTPASGGAD